MDKDIRAKCKRKLEEIAERNEQIHCQLLARRKRFKKLVLSGEAVELRHGQIQFTNNPYMEFLIELDSLDELRDAMKSNAEGVIEIICYDCHHSRPPSVIIVRPEAICYISEYQENKWFLVDGNIHSLPQEGFEAFMNEGVE